MDEQSNGHHNGIQRKASQAEIVEAAAKTEGDKSWKTLFREFLGETTFHGLSYIAHDAYFSIRRVIWLIITMGVAALFLYLVINQLVFLAGHPRAVNVEIIFADDVQYPAVTLCNQNYFRKTAATKHGMYDVITNSFNSVRDIKNSNETYNPYGFDDRFVEEGEQGYLYGIGDSYSYYATVPFSVCKDLCVEVHSDTCCSVVYFESRSDCFITPLDASLAGVELVPKENARVARRKECQLQSETECDFEQSMCSFLGETTIYLSWAVTKAKYDGKKGKITNYDHTTLSGHGHYIHAYLDDIVPNLQTDFISPFLVVDKDTCLEFYYQIDSGHLEILNSTTDTRKEPTSLWIASPLGTPNGWESARLMLPYGFNRLTFRAWTTQEAMAIDIAIDDIKVGPCKEVKDCKDTPLGTGYRGDLDRAVTGEVCDLWYEGLNILKNLGINDTNSLGLNGNKCRNPDGDVRGPWCFVNAMSGHMAYCDVPSCACNAQFFKCRNNLCIAPELACDGVDDCGDGTDELFCGADHYSTFNCTFDDKTNCGYDATSISNPNIEPQILEEEGERFYSVMLSNEGSPGDLIRIISPMMQLESDSCLRFDVRLKAATLDLGLAKPNTPWLEQPMCTVAIPEHEAWQTVFIDLAEESDNTTNIVLFSVTFEPIAGEISYMQMDNITLFGSVCEDVIPQEPTTMAVMTTESDFTNSTEIPPTANFSTATFESNETVSELVTESSINPTGGPAGGPGRVKRAVGTLTTAWYNEGNSTDDYYDSNVTEWNTEMTTEASILTTAEPAIDRITTCDYLEECISCYRPLVPPLTYESSNTTDNTTDEPTEQPTEEPTTQSPDCVEGVECDFFTGCGCGYAYVSANVNDKWIIGSAREGILSNDTSDDDDTAALFRLRGWIGAWAGLRSPIDTRPNGTYCLSLNYMVSYAELAVYKYTNLSLEYIAGIPTNAAMPKWHPLRIPIEGGSFGVLFVISFKTQVVDEFYNGIDAVKVLSGSCSDIPYGGNQLSVNCTFEDNYLCGYQELYYMNEVNWFRSYDKSRNASFSNYYMRTRSTLNKGKLYRGLQSPAFTINRTSCLNFFFYMQATTKVTQIAQLAVVAVDGNMDGHFGTQPPKVIWRVTDVIDNNWHKAQGNIEAGYWRLVFELNGEEMRGGIDEITVVPRECPNLVAFSVDGPTDWKKTPCVDQYEFPCFNNFTGYGACISDVYKCNEKINCFDAEDEDDCKTTVDTPGSSGRLPSTVQLPEDLTPYYRNAVNDNNPGPVNDLEGLYRTIGSQREDLIYSCNWQGLPCNDDDFFPQVTDYGMCYTFNVNQSIAVDTRDTGARFGLSLTLNIEQYEYMTGPNSDAGIKMFLHPAYEVPQVRDLGFAVAPGTHTLVGIQLSRASNLPDPWGDCAETNLTLFTNYTYSGCLLQDETMTLNDSCQCRDAYMPAGGGFEQLEGPILCELSTYFECAVPVVYGVINDSRIVESDCPKPCEQDVFEGSLSYATLSTLSVSTILDKDISDIQSSHNEALDIGYRIYGEEFIQDINVFETIISMFSKLMELSNQYVKDGPDGVATITKVSVCAKTMADVCVNDTETYLFGDMNLQMTTFEAAFGSILHSLTTSMDLVSSALSQLRLQFNVAIHKKEITSLMKEITKSTGLTMESVSFLLGLIQERYANVTLALEMANIPTSQAKYLPIKLYLEDDCVERIEIMLSMIKELSDMGDQITAYTGTTLNLDDTAILKSFISMSHTFDSNRTAIHQCVFGYHTDLSASVAWKEDARERIQQQSRSGQELIAENGLAEDLKKLEKHYKDAYLVFEKYLKSKIDRMGMLSAFESNNGVNDALVQLTLFSDRLTDGMVNPTKTFLTDVQSTLQSIYMEGLQQAVIMQQYFKEQYYYTKAYAMYIWKIPEANLKNPTSIKDQGREIWRIWDSNRPIADFVEPGPLSADTFVEQGLETYFDPLIAIVGTFNTQVKLVIRKLDESLNTVNSQQIAYEEKRVIGHDFISDNFLTLDVYFKQMKYQSVTQSRAYEFGNFLSDLGGFLGLLLGGSVISVVELLDFCIYNYALKRHFSRERKKRKMANGSSKSDSKKANILPTEMMTKEDPENGFLTAKF